MKRNTESVKEMDIKLVALLDRTGSIGSGISSAALDSLELFSRDYLSLDGDAKFKLGSPVSSMLALSKSLGSAEGLIQQQYSLRR